jgi:hypothetical protein
MTRSCLGRGGLPDYLQACSVLLVFAGWCLQASPGSSRPPSCCAEYWVQRAGSLEGPCIVLRPGHVDAPEHLVYSPTAELPGQLVRQVLPCLLSEHASLGPGNLAPVLLWMSG